MSESGAVSARDPSARLEEALADNASLRRHASSVAHDFNNLLAAILGRAELLQKLGVPFIQLAMNLPEEVAERQPPPARVPAMPSSARPIRLPRLGPRPRKARGNQCFCASLSPGR
jgi:signal transduction histidine kinase